MKKKLQRKKLQLSRETLSTLQPTGGTIGVIVGVAIETVIQALSQDGRGCHMSASIDPPTCCITCPTMACDCAG